MLALDPAGARPLADLVKPVEERRRQREQLHVLTHRRCFSTDATVRLDLT
jgi:hypothetical protein